MDRLIYEMVSADGIYKLFYSAMDTNDKWHIGLTQGTSLKELQGYKYSNF